MVKARAFLRGPKHSPEIWFQLFFPSYSKPSLHSSNPIHQLCCIPHSLVYHALPLGYAQAPQTWQVFRTTPPPVFPIFGNGITIHPVALRLRFHLGFLPLLYHTILIHIATNDDVFIEHLLYLQALLQAPCILLS